MRNENCLIQAKQAAKQVPLNTLRFFEAAARLGSFAKAGDELRITHGAVSRQIRLLEEAWANWRSVSNTDTGHGDSQTYEHFYLSLQAACAGLGVALGSAFIAQEEIDSARLVAPFGFIRDGSEYFLLSPLPFNGDPRRTVFLQWMRQQMHHAPP